MALSDITRRAGLALGLGLTATLGLGAMSAAADFPDRPSP
ncbi:hypothetical protein ACVITL_003748 [Rhizobium pisi]